MRKTGLIYSDALLGYDFGEHVLKPVRMRMTCDLLQAYSIFTQPNAVLLEPQTASREEILTVHDEDYVSVVERLSRGEVVYDAYMYGFRHPDNPPFPGMYEASLLYTGASLQAANLVMSGDFDIVFSISGGLHHAQRRMASGFCVFNDPAITLHRMLDKWDRIAYVDIDAHHGDGVQNAFYDSNRVLTCSIHETGRRLFPGTGFVEEIGTGSGKGYSLNAPLAPYTDDDTLWTVTCEAVLPVLHAFNPQALMLQLGADGHFEDPIAHLYYTSHGWLRVVKALLDFGLPTVALGGGGYNLFTVCRLWALAFGEMVGYDLPQEIPDEFFNKYRIRVLRDIFTPEAPSVDRRRVAELAEETIDGIQKLIFPYYGIETHR